MATDENQSKIRVKNQIDILNILRRGKTTLPVLADNLGVSFTSVSKITDELVQNKLLKYSKKNKSSIRGRKPIFVELNNDLGVVCCINYASSTTRIILATLDSTIVAEKVIPNVNFITKEVLVETENGLRELLKDPKVNNRKLLSICVVAPGLLSPDGNGFVASRFVKAEDIIKINPVLHFSNAFNVKVEMHNDVRIACFGELKHGVFPKEIFNGMFIHLGISSGITLIFDGKIYHGSYNFSGETASYVWNYDDQILKESSWNGKLFSLFEIENKIREKNGQPLLGPNSTFNVDKIVEDYNANDASTVEAIEESAKRNAITIIGLTALLDVEFIVIEGQILKLGSRYIDLLRKYISDFSNNLVRAKIIVSTLKESCEILGGCYQASNIYLLDQVESITKIRTKSPKFELDKIYKEI